MNKSILVFSFLGMFLFVSCGKSDKKEFKKDQDKDKIEYELDLCDWDEASEAAGPDFEKYVVEELFISEECGCIEKGMEKFLENGVTKYLIYYAEKDCVGYGYKVFCPDGDCDEGVKCKFLQDCGEG